MPTLPGPSRGFSLLELMVVVAIIALASALVTLAVPDPAHARLAREGERLALLLEAGRAQSRALGIEVRWVPGPSAQGDAQQDFRFEGLPPRHALPDRWLDADSHALIQVRLPERQAMVRLGPDPILSGQRIELLMGDRHLVLATDGLGPFAVVNE